MKEAKLSAYDKLAIRAEVIDDLKDFLADEKHDMEEVLKRNTQDYGEEDAQLMLSTKKYEYYVNTYNALIAKIDEVLNGTFAF